MIERDFIASVDVLCIHATQAGAPSITLTNQALNEMFWGCVDVAC